MLKSSLAVQSKDIKNDAAFQVARADSVELEIVRAQNRAIELEGLLDEFSEKEQKAIEELKEKLEAVTRLETEVFELKRNEALAWSRILKKFRSLEDYQEEVEIAAFKYFGKGFDFCKRQLDHHHPNLGIDLDNMDIDCEMLEKEEAAEEKEGDKEKGEEQEKGEENTNPLSP